MAIDHDARLAALRLQSVVAAQLVVSEFALGAAGIAGSIGWVLLTQTPERGLGPALLWMHKNELASVNVVVDSDKVAAVLTRRAELFALDITVWSVSGNQLVATGAAPVSTPRSVPAQHMSFIQIIEQAGATPVCEHGVLAGDVLGLEVCRVVDDASADGGARLAIGVGAHDRELFQMVNGSVVTVASLSKVVCEVALRRQAGAPAHPLNRLAAERYLREMLIASPDFVGASQLRRAEPPVARSNLKESIPCVALGTQPAGQVVVVCCAILDPDLVSFAADARLHLAADGDLVLAVAPNNVLPSMLWLARSLQQPARFAEVNEFRR